MAKGRIRDENGKLDQEKEELRLDLLRADLRLDNVDPERFIVASNAAYDAAKFNEVEKLATNFVERQQEAFGRAAEFLSEQALIDSDVHPHLAADALRFAKVGLAAFPDSKRLVELVQLSAAREAGASLGEPLEALNIAGLNAAELNHLSMALFKAGKFVLSEIAAKRCVPLMYFQKGESSFEYAVALGQHGLALQKLEEYTLAESLMREGLTLFSSLKIEGTEHPDYAKALNNFAGLLADMNAAEEAEEKYLQAIQIRESSSSSDDPLHAGTLSSYGVLLMTQGRVDEAEIRMTEALEIDRRTIGDKHENYGIHLSNFGNLLELTGHLPKAEIAFRDASEILRNALGESHPTAMLAIEYSKNFRSSHPDLV